MPRNKLPFDYRLNAGIFIAGAVTGKVSIDSSYDVVIDTTLDGNITTSGFCEIAENGDFTGAIISRSITIYGKTNGENTGFERIDVKKSAYLTGRYQTPNISLESGSIVDARILPLHQDQGFDQA